MSFLLCAGTICAPGWASWGWTRWGIRCNECILFVAREWDDGTHHPSFGWPDIAWGHPWHCSCYCPWLWKYKGFRKEFAVWWGICVHFPPCYIDISNAGQRCASSYVVLWSEKLQSRKGEFDLSEVSELHLLVNCVCLTDRTCSRNWSISGDFWNRDSMCSSTNNRSSEEWQHWDHYPIWQWSCSTLASKATWNGFSPARW